MVATVQRPVHTNTFSFKRRQTTSLSSLKISVSKGGGAVVVLVAFEIVFGNSDCSFRCYWGGFSGAGFMAL